MLQSSRQGWLAQHVLLWEPVGGQLMGCVPLYLKTHSYGAQVSLSFLCKLSLTSFLSAAVQAACLSLQGVHVLNPPLLSKCAIASLLPAAEQLSLHQNALG